MRALAPSPALSLTSLCNSYSLILGRPPSIADAYCDAREPANVELSDIKPGEPIVSRPLHEPTTATYNILRKRFAKIIGKITFHFQKLHEPATFEDVEALDKEIRQFRDELPPPLRLENPDTSLDEELEFLPTHRYNLATEILFVTITLHRPWLLRKLKSDKFALSRRACFESAKLDFRIRKEFKSKYPARHNMYQAGQFRAFNTAMIAGISAIMAPHNEDSAEMRAIMAEFLDEHPIDKQMKKDHMTQKETAIVSSRQIGNQSSQADLDCLLFRSTRSIAELSQSSKATMSTLADILENPSRSYSVFAKVIRRSTLHPRKFLRIAP